MKGLKKHCNNATVLARFLALILSAALALGLASCENASNNPALLAALGTPPVTNPATPTTGGGTETTSSGGETETPTTNGEGQNESEEKPLAFLEDWEKMEFLFINDDGKLDTKIDAPWNKAAASTLMPDNIRFDIKKDEGWDVAFNLMNQDGRPDMNYFGLYNKYIGVLRIFYYCNQEVTGSATDFAFEVILGSDGQNSKAFYNSLRYGIPNDANVNTSVNTLGDGNVAKTYHLIVTPYSGIGRSTLYKGWHAFDVDMSAYTGQKFTENGASIQIACKASNKTNVCLGTDITGKIFGDLSGTIDKTSMMAGADGVSGVLSSISSMLGGTGDSSLAAMESALLGGGLLASLNKYSLLASTAFNVLAKGYDYITGTNQIPKDKLNGKLDLKINAHADTTGYLETAVATNVKQFVIGPTAFNPNSNLGKGVWQITTSPKIYVIDDRIVCTKTDKPVGYENYETGYYDAKIYFSECNGQKCFDLLWYYNDLRIPYFFDPSTFDVIINPELFPDASDIKTLAYCGIFTNQNTVNDSAFRTAMGIQKAVPKAISYEEAVSWKDVENSSDILYGVKNPIEKWPGMGGSLDSNKWSRRFVIYDKEAFKNYDVKFDNSLNYESYGKSDSIHYYGQKVKLYSDKNLPCDFIIEPQIFYPELNLRSSIEELKLNKPLWIKDIPSAYEKVFEGGNASIADMMILTFNERVRPFYDIKEFPNLYVVVVVQFKSGGETYFYSRKYLPSVENVSYETAKSIASGIQTRAAGQHEKLFLSDYVTSINNKLNVLGRNDFPIQ